MEWVQVKNANALKAHQKNRHNNNLLLIDLRQLYIRKLYYVNKEKSFFFHGFS